MFSEALLAERRERAAELAPELVEGGAGDHDPTRLGELLEARHHVHAVAVEVAVGFADHVAEVDADPEADALLLHGTAASSRSAMPRWMRIAHSTASTALANSHSAPSPMSLTMRPRCSARSGSTSFAVRLEALEGAALVGLHQARVAGHVRGEDGGEAALGLGRRARPRPHQAGARDLALVPHAFLSRRQPMSRPPLGGRARPSR